MVPELIVNRDETRAPKVPFRLRDFRRVLGLVRPHRKTLIRGLILTLFFATFHTLSVSGAFPVFKILLDKEGLSAWVDRIVAGERIGADLVSVDGTGFRITGLHPDGPAAKAGILVKDQIFPSSGSDPTALTNELAAVAVGEKVSVRTRTRTGERLVSLQPRPAEAPFRFLRWAASFVPADTAQQKIRALAVVLAALVIAAVVANFCRYYGEVFVAKAVLRSLMDLRAVLYEHVLALPMSFFAAQPTADLVTRFVQDIQELQRGLITFFGKFIREPLRIAFLLSWAMLVDWRITLMALAVTPIVIAVFWVVGRKVKNANKKLLQAYGMMIGALTATLENLRVVKAYTAERQEQQRLDRVDRHMFRQQLKLAKLDAFTGPMMEILAVVAGSLVTVWLLSRVLNHELSLPKFVTLGVALSVLFDPLRKLSDVWVRIQRSLAAGERIFHVLEEPVESSLGKNGAELPPLRRAIELVNVSFIYPRSERPALQGINLTILAGETVALVGPNGSGKTTLMSLLLRFYDPTHGEIRFDGVDIRQVTLDSLRSQMSLVTQESVVFAGTPGENIAYGNAADPASIGDGESEIGNQLNGRVEDAARRAFADEFIRALPQGYEATLGERGSTLSGGQRQRLAIARAVYRDAPILIFDEATSQIDSESELRIQTALREFSKDRTTILIAHRLSTIQFATRIVVLDAGRILDQGTHTELLARCPLYRTLCETQLIAQSPRGESATTIDP